MLHASSVGGRPVRKRYLLAIVAVLGACAHPSLQTTYDPGDEGSSSGGFAGVTFEGGTAGKGGATGIDTRPVVTAARTPPPISGGTLLALRRGGAAVMSDPDRDRILVVDTRLHLLGSTITLETGAEPGRLVEDASQHVHVLLRGTGELLSLDPTTGETLERRAVCKAPRGLAYDAPNDSLVVACLEGSLVELPASGGEPTRVTELATDLRDVVFLGNQLVVTRFRSAELLYLDDERAITLREKLPVLDPSFQADVAWRAIATPDGSLLVAHQRAFSGSIDTGGGVGAGGGSQDPGVAGSAGSAGSAGTGFAGSAGGPGTEGGYGMTGVPCSAVVRSAVTTADAAGNLAPSVDLGGATLPVDVAVSAGGLVALANAASGNFDTTLSVFWRDSLSQPSTCGLPDAFADVQSATIAVAFDPVSGALLAQTREPSQLFVYDPETLLSEVVPLGGASVADTGHELFHADSGRGIACASCHPEGTDDGHVWTFSGQGLRRTQALDVSLAGTAPFHWDGELATFGDLVTEVFGQRMGGPEESPERIAALEHFVDGIPRRPAVRAADDEAALRGKVWFESEDVACTSCHSGPRLSNGKTESIGKGDATQVPSLLGVSARAPFMHDGCAATLADRFDPVCGGDRHGNAQFLDEAARQDLIAYLETL